MKRKWLFVGTCKPLVVNDLEFINEIIKILYHFSSKSENVLTIGDLNVSIGNAHLNTLLQLFNLNALINFPTCYESHIPISIDHILANQKSLFKFSKTFETGFSGHHKLISTKIKSGTSKCPPKKIYRYYKNFDIANFSNTLKGDLEGVNDNSYKSFEKL